MTEDPKSYVIPLAKGMILSGQEWAALFYHMNDGRPIPRPLRRRMWNSGLLWRVGSKELMPETTRRMMIEQAPRSPWKAPRAVDVTGRDRNDPTVVNDPPRQRLSPIARAAMLAAVLSIPSGR